MTTELDWQYDYSIWPGPDSQLTFPVGTVVCYREPDVSHMVGTVQTSNEEVTAVYDGDWSRNPGQTTYKTEDLVAYLGEPLAT